MKRLLACSAIILVTATTQTAFADLTNGTFEDGLTGWTATTNTEGSGLANPLTIASGLTTTSAGTINPSPTNDQYVYTSQTGPGNSVLTQTFTVQSDVNRVFFDIAINNSGFVYATPNTLNYSGAPNQQAWFDILVPGASRTTLDAADIIVTAYATQVGDPLSMDWTTNEVDVSSELASYIGQDVIFRFVQVDNQGTFNLVIDNVNVGLTQIAQILSTLASATANSNYPAYPAARVIDATPELLSQFISLTGDDTAISNAVTQTLPLLTGGSMLVTSNTLARVNQIIQSRTAINAGMSSGDEFFSDNNVWMKPFGSWADQKDRSGVSGFKADTAGLVIGADAEIQNTARLGVAFAYAETDVDGNSSIAPHNVNTDFLQVIGYGSYSLNPKTELIFQVDAGKGMSEGQRVIAFTSSVANSDYDSITAHVGLGLERTMKINERTEFSPELRADYSWIRDDSYSETGAGVFNLSVDSRNTDELILAVDGKIVHSFNDMISMSGVLGVGYDTINEQASITAIFAGAPGASFVTDGIEPSPWIGRASAGLTYIINDGIELTANYDANYRQDFLNQTASLKFSWAF